MNAPKYAPRVTVAARNPRGRQLAIAAVLLIVVVFGISKVLHHENRYEKLAQNLTQALQSNDIDAVKKYQNAETATTISRGIVGRAADELAPLGKIKRVKETTPAGSESQTHEFEVVFDKGTVDEKMKVDPDFKIVHFRYEKVPQ